jgi:molybdopterin molybdotransferase
VRGAALPGFGHDERVRDATLQQALELARANAVGTEAEEVPVAAAAGRRLAADVTARADLPGEDASAMDGYAIRAADAPGELAVAGESAAGAPLSRGLAPGSAARISTGARLPPGADAVVRREDAVERGARVRVPAAAPGDHVRRRGEVLAAGAVLLAAGAWVGPHEVVALGSAGLASVRCRRRPRVALLATGAELVPLGDVPRPGAVWDSSRVGLASQAAAAGGRPVAALTVGDDAGATLLALEALLDEGDERPELVVTAGGVGGGRHDHVRAALARAGVEEILRGVMADPCRPVWLGRRADQVVLGLPGNPVSAAVGFHVIGRELLGRREDWRRRAALARDWPAHADREDLPRCAIAPDGRLEPMPHQGSHAVTSLCGADAIARIPAGGGGPRAGEAVAYSALTP